MNYKVIPSICPYCGCGCGVALEVLDGKLINTLPLKTAPVNEGKLCLKGYSAHEFVNSPHRLTAPLLKEPSGWQEASWEEALTHVVTRLQEIKKKHGPEAIAFLTSAKCTNEENYLLQKFSRAVIGTNNIDHCARLWHSSTVAGLAAALGSGAMTNSLEELEKTDCIFLIGSNPTENHPLVATRIYRAKEKGAKLLIADPRLLQLSSLADLQVRQRLGTDIALLNGMMYVILQKGWQDTQFIEKRTENFEEFEKVISQYPPERVAQITGVAVKDIEKLAEYYACSPTAAIVYAMGITQHTTGVANVLSLANLAMLTGKIGRESAGIYPLRGQNNVQGACDMGGLPNFYPGYQPVNKEEIRRKFEEAWGVPLPAQEGLTVSEIFSAISAGKVKALIIMGENPIVSDPDSQHIELALKSIPFLVVIDIFMSHTAELAEVILPGAAFAEKDGTFTNTERRVQRLMKAIEPPGKAKPEWQIIQDLANLFGYKMNYASPREIMEEIARLTPSYRGISYDRLGGSGIFWPCPDAQHPGTRILHREQFTRGKGRFHAVEYQPAAELPDDDYPFSLTTGRIFAQFHTGTMTRISPSLQKEINECFVEINPADAQELKIKQGEMIYVQSRRGTVKTRVLISERVGPGVVFMPFHFYESRANILTNPVYDPVAKIPEYKVCAVRLSKVEGPHKI